MPDVRKLVALALELGTPLGGLGTAQDPQANVVRFSNGSAFRTDRVTLGQLAINDQLLGISSAQNFGRTSAKIAGVAAQVTQVQTSIDDLAADVWSFEIDGSVIGGASSALTVAGRYTDMLTQEKVLQRSMFAPHFLFTQDFIANGFDTLAATQLFSVVPGDKLGSETRQEFLTRVVPSFTWETNFPDPDLVTGFLTVDPHGLTMGVLYSPLVSAPSLAEIKALWDYTPASGPPVRNGIDDSMQIYSLLPVQF